MLLRMKARIITLGTQNMARLLGLAHAIISMLGLAQVFSPLIRAMPLTCKQNKCIQLRQHHILLNM